MEGAEEPEKAPEAGEEPAEAAPAEEKAAEAPAEAAAAKEKPAEAEAPEAGTVVSSVKERSHPGSENGDLHCTKREFLPRRWI